MKKKITLIVSLFTFSVLTILLMYLVSDKNEAIQNSFTRIFVPDPIQESSTLNAIYDSYYIAGATSNKIYLGNITAPLHLLITNTELTDTQRVSIKNMEDLQLRSTQITIDSPYFFMTDLVSNAILRGTLKNLQASRYMYDSAFFAEAVPISNSTFVTRTFGSNVREYVLARQTQHPPYIKRTPGLLEKQIDGLFCTDGMLHYNEGINSLVYVYYYRNQFICMDTSLNLLYRNNTIDTVSRAQIEVAEIKSDNSITLASPPMIVNKKSCVSGNFLFINSNLLAKNEKKETFETASVVDVYHLKDGTYKFSFYLPAYQGIKVSSFKVFNNLLIALYNRHVLTYELAPNYFGEMQGPNVKDVSLSKVDQM